MGNPEWLHWDLHVEVIVGLALVLLFYELLAHSSLTSFRRISFIAGLCVILIALNGPLHTLADHYLFSAHMVQHLLLTLAAAPLLLAGLPRSLTRRGPADGLLSCFTSPLIAFALYNITLIIWHVPLFYEWAMRHHNIHIVQHLLFLGTALLLWWPVAGPPLGDARLAPPAQLLYLFVAGLPMILISAFVTLADEPLYRFYTEAPRIFGLSPLADQIVGGVIMWVPGSLVYLLVITVVYFRWVAHEQSAVSDQPSAPAENSSRLNAEG